MTDLDTIRERHTNGGAYMTNTCQHGPHLTDEDGLCDTRVVLDALDRESSNHDVTYQGANRCCDERNAEAAHAKALAEALRETGECWCPAADDPARDDECIRCAALAAYDEDHR